MTIQQDKLHREIDRRIQASENARVAGGNVWRTERWACGGCSTGRPLGGNPATATLDEALAESLRRHEGIVLLLDSSDQLQVCCGENCFRDLQRQVDRKLVGAVQRVPIKVDDPLPVPITDLAERVGMQEKRIEFRCARAQCEERAERFTRRPVGAPETAWAPSLAEIEAQLKAPTPGWIKVGSRWYCSLDHATRDGVSMAAAQAGFRPLGGDQAALAAMRGTAVPTDDAEARALAKLRLPLPTQATLEPVAKLSDATYNRELDRVHAVRGLPPGTTPACPPNTGTPAPARRGKGP